MKACFKCGAMKHIDDFYRHPRMSDGHLNKCKDCTKKDVSANYRLRIGQYADYDAKRDKSESRREKLRVTRRRWYAINREKLRANTALGHAVQRHGLQRQPCEICGAFPTEGHHDDYSKPIEVRWLCRTHHLEVHGKVRRQRL